MIFYANNYFNFLMENVKKTELESDEKILIQKLKLKEITYKSITLKNKKINLIKNISIK